MKKTILHIIKDLGRGGAERMLVTVVRHLEEYDHIIVTLYPENQFEEETDGYKIYCLDLSSRFLIPLASIKLRKIIKQHNVDLVHSHLFWSNVVARLGVPRNIPLITTIHAFVASSIDYTPWHMRLIERVTYQVRKSIIVAVAKKAEKEYFEFIQVKPYKARHLYTFVDTDVFKDNGGDQYVNKESGEFRLISVGNLKVQKNHRYLVEAFKKLKNENVSLDIYGAGILQKELQKEIDEHALKITLKGQVKNINEIIKQYDLFVMSSLYEGFALSVLEAMAMGMPLLLSDIDSFTEQCEDTAVYFSLADTDDFVEKLKKLLDDRGKLFELGQKAKQRVLENFTLEQHLSGLRSIYSDTLSDNL